MLHDAALVGEGVNALREAPIALQASVNELIVSAEMEALNSADIPYFQAHIDERHLYNSDDSLMLADFFEASPLDRVERRIAHLRSGLAPVNWVASAAIRTARINKNQVILDCCSVLPPVPPTGRVLIDAAEAIAERVCDLACIDGDDISWATLRVNTASQWQVVAMDRSLYLGTAGVLLFLETLKMMTGLSHRVSDVYRRLLRQWQRTDVATTTSLGAFDGVAADLYLAYRMQESGDWLNNRRVALVDRLRVTNEPLDLLSGAAGIVLILSRLVGRHAAMRQSALRSATPHVEQLLEEFQHVGGGGGVWPTLNDKPLVGFAHGVSGIAYGLMSFVDSFPDSDLAKPVRSTVDAAHAWQTAMFDDAAGNWPDLREMPERPAFSPSWCNGSAGIGIARAGAVGRDTWNLPNLQSDTEHAVRASLQYGIGSGQGLCHGDLGTAELLLAAGLAFNRPNWVHASRRVAGMVASDVLSNRGITTLEFGPNVDIPGLMVGAAGVGYELLRIAAPSSVPSILTLEL